MGNTTEKIDSYENGWAALRDAIIEKAVSDYKALVMGRTSRKERCNMLEIERFFKSDLCKNLLIDTDVSGEDILRELHSFRDEYYDSLTRKGKKHE